MITAWILYAVVIGALVGLGALAVERLLRERGLPARWLWVSAMVVTLFWPMAHRARSIQPQGQAAVSQETHPPVSGSVARETIAPTALLEDVAPQTMVPVLIALEPKELEVPPRSFLRALDGPFLISWALATAILLLFFGHLLRRAHYMRNLWQGGGR